MAQLNPWDEGYTVPEAAPEAAPQFNTSADLNPWDEGYTLPDQDAELPPEATYNTPLSAADEHHYKAWEEKSGRTGDTHDYDMRGAWSGMTAETGQAANGHFTDQFKKPNHPTFSDQSQYSNGDQQGGHWDEEGDKVSFTPSEFNLKNKSPEELRAYFQKVEPDVTLNLPDPTKNPNGFVVNPDGGQQDALNADRDAGVFDAPKAPEAPIMAPHDPSKPYTHDELYGPVDRDPKYNELNKAENGFFHVGAYTKTANPDGSGEKYGGYVGLDGTMDPKLIDLKNQKEQEKQNIYTHTGEAQKFPDWMPGVGGEEYRTMETRVPNPRYNRNLNPMHPDLAGNQGPTISSTFLVPPPEADAVHRMAYDILRDIGAGTFDAVTQGKFLTPGAASKQFPPMPGDGVGEDLATTAIVLGLPSSVGGPAYTKAVQALGTLGPKAAVVATIAKSFTPQEIDRIGEAAKYAAKIGGTGVSAMMTADLWGKKLIAGLGLITAEGAVSPDNMQGLITPETVKKYVPFEISDEHAQDLSFALDSPIISGAIMSVGGIFGTAGKMVRGAFGGITEMFPSTTKAISHIPIIGVTQYERGLKILTTFDENLLSQGPKESAANIKILSDLFAKHDVDMSKLGKEGAAISLDSATAFTQFGQEYFRKAYAYKEAYMGKEGFDQWVAQQATTTANRMMQVRTELGETAENIATQATHETDSLVKRSSDTMAGGDLTAAQGKTAEIAHDTIEGKTDEYNALDAQGNLDHKNATAANQIQYDNAERQAGLDKDALTIENKNAEKAAEAEKRTLALRFREMSAKADARKEELEATHTKLSDDTKVWQGQADEQTAAAKQEAEDAKDRASRAISSDPAIRYKTNEILDDNPFGAGTEGERMHNMSGPVYESLKSVKAEKDAAYKKIADSGAQGDGDSFLQLIADHYPADEKGNITITNPLIRKFATSVANDDSFANIYNNIKPQISEALRGMDPSNSDFKLLQSLRENATKGQLEHLMQNGDDDVAAMAHDANDKFINYWNTFKNYDPMKEISDSADAALKKEGTKKDALGLGQGISNYRDTFTKVVGSNLNNDDTGQFLKYLSNAAKAGGKDIDHDIVHALSAKSIENLTKSLDSGSAESIATLRTSLNDTINGLKNFAPDHPILKKWEELRASVEKLGINADEKAAAAEKLASSNETLKKALERKALESRRDTNQKQGFITKAVNGARDKIADRGYELDKGVDSLKEGNSVKADLINERMKGEKTTLDTNNRFAKEDLDAVQEKVAQLKAATDNSVLNRFIAKSEFGNKYGKEAMGAGDASDAMTRIFNGKTSSTDVKNLLKHADTLPEGHVIREAMQGAFLRHIWEKTRSTANMGIVELSADGVITNAARSNKNKASKFLQGKDRDIFDRLFPGDTQTEAELHHLINLRANLTMKTPNASGKSILKMERSEDPQQAVGSLITLTLGNLNRRATQVRKLTGPLAAKTLEDVKARKAGELENVMAHPMEMSKMGKKTANSIEDAEHRRVFLNSIGRGIGRFNSNATSDWVSQLHVPHYSDLQSEMSNLFGSSAPTDEEDYTQDNTPVDDEN